MRGYREETWHKLMRTQLPIPVSLFSPLRVHFLPRHKEQRRTRSLDTSEAQSPGAILFGFPSLHSTLKLKLLFEHQVQVFKDLVQKPYVSNQNHSWLMPACEAHGSHISGIGSASSPKNLRIKKKKNRFSKSCALGSYNKAIHKKLYCHTPQCAYCICT